MLNSGVITGALACLAALSSLVHMPALGVFFSDPATAQSLTQLLTAVLALSAGAMKGWADDHPTPPSAKSSTAPKP